MFFDTPNILWLLLVLPPALVAFFWWSWRTRQQLMTRFIQSRLLAGLTAGISPLRQKLRLGLIVLAVACLILALAGPRWGASWEDVQQRGIDIVVAIDCSKSMLAQDIAPNRLARAKLAALELMQKARTDRLGLVAFAGSAFLECPLTIDDTAFSQSVDALNVNTISQGGTAIAEAIDSALTAFKEKDNHKVLVLITDGEDHDSGAVEAAQKAAEEGLRIYTIGIGTPQGELLFVKDPQGHSEYVRDEEGHAVKSRLNEELLREIAGKTEGGFYLRLQGAKTIDTLYAEGLSKLPKTAHQEKRVKQYHQRFQWPLGAAIVLLVAEMLIPERRRELRSAPAPRVVAPKAAAGVAALLLFLAMAPATFAASPTTALRDYKAGKFDQALKQYEQLLERNSDDPRLHFNAGAAAYRNRHFEESVKQFNAALASPDVKLQELAYYNRGNSQYWLGEQNQDPQKKTEAWEKALKDYDFSLKLDSQDPDARFNKEFVKKKLEELKQQQQQQQKNQPNNIEPSEEAKKAKAAADDAVRRRDYAKALEIMETQLSKDPTTSYYSDYIQRLKDVNGVQETAKH